VGVSIRDSGPYKWTAIDVRACSAISGWGGVAAIVGSTQSTPCAYGASCTRRRRTGPTALSGRAPSTPSKVGRHPIRGRRPPRHHRPQRHTLTSRALAPQCRPTRAPLSTATTWTGSGDVALTRKGPHGGWGCDDACSGPRGLLLFCADGPVPHAVPAVLYGVDRCGRPVRLRRRPSACTCGWTALKCRSAVPEPASPDAASSSPARAGTTRSPSSGDLCSGTPVVRTPVPRPVRPSPGWFPTGQRPEPPGARLLTAGCCVFNRPR
jgi:hypothetical protein